MSFPREAVAKGSEIPLGTLIGLMRIAADNPDVPTVALALPPDYRAYLGCLKPGKESAFHPVTNERYMRINELCGEALPYMTKIYEWQEEARKAKERADQAERVSEARAAKIRGLERTLYALCPWMDRPLDDDE
jgi:hypothetical protein